MKISLTYLLYFSDVYYNANYPAHEISNAQKREIILDNQLLTFIPGQRGNALLVYNGFTFAKNLTHLDTTYWCCRSRKSGRPACRARATTIKKSNGLYKLIVTRPDHNHGPSLRMQNKFKRYPLIKI